MKELGGNSFVIVVERAHNFFDINEMRTLVAIVDALDEYALAARRSVTVPLVREWAHSAA